MNRRTRTILITFFSQKEKRGQQKLKQNLLQKNLQRDLEKSKVFEIKKHFNSEVKNKNLEIIISIKESSKKVFKHIPSNFRKFVNYKSLFSSPFRKKILQTLKLTT